MSTPRLDVQTCLWFDGRIDEAADFYVSLIPDSRILARTAYAAGGGPPDGPDMTGQALTVDLVLGGVPYTLLNGGPAFPLSEAVSIVLTVQTQEEVDRLWEALIADGGAESQCGWCRDRFGLSWQVVPERLNELLRGPHAEAVTREMMTQVKLDIARLEAAAES
ncbi:VOC family protein [Brachybacterium sp. J153]|uniref:VOC family protein n=1 Tax=Brachybacterium sp. J153 TaxID=3116488 RepID=UPI002E78EE7F|nr:VOC family protein [Brachybacterium sp. J153]MEE1618307.1 VOC family protein [Brachybacterium sp. J153]